MSAISAINITRTKILYISSSLMKLDFVAVFDSAPSSGINDSGLPKRRILTPFPRDGSPHLDSREPGKQIPLL
jgi:hypothetical protein